MEDRPLTRPPARRGSRRLLARPSRVAVIVAALLALGVLIDGSPARPIPVVAAAPQAATVPAGQAEAARSPSSSGLSSDARTREEDEFAGIGAPQDAPQASAPEPPQPVEPTIQYEEALAHADDPNDFTPGGRVTIGYTPRSDDGWPIDDHRPTALPAGQVSGHVLAAMEQGSTWASSRGPAGGPDGAAGGPDGAVDQPDGADEPTPTGAVPAATLASFTQPIADDALAPGAVSGLRRQVFGFLPYWNVGDSSTVLKYDYLSTIAYFSVGADVKGNLLKRNSDGSVTTGWGGWTSSRLTTVINNAHQHHTRVVLTISVFAWTSGQADKQGRLLGSSTARLNLAKQAAAAVRARGADGINLDFEPIASGHAADFTAFVRTVRAELNKIKSGYQLTFDTTGYIGNYPIEAATASGGADAIFIMGYDYRGSSSSTAGSIDPLNGSSYTLNDTIRAYTARVSAKKLLLGLPYYGRAWSTTSSALRAPNQSGTKYGASTSVIYDTAANLVKVYGRRYDATEAVAWFAYKRQNCTATYGCVTSWREVYYDDAQSLKARYDLVIRSGLRGSGMWALGYDGTRPELYGAISLKYLHDTTAPEAGVAILPSRTVDAGFVVRWKAADDSAIRGYDVQVSIDGGAWAAWLTGTTAASDVYLGADGHGYAFRVRATDAYGNIGQWDVSSLYDATPSLAVGGFGRVRADGVGLRVSPDTASLRVATVNTGDIVAIVGGPVGADGYTWYEVAGPLAEWNTVSFTRSGVWLAVRSSTETYVSAAVAPNATGIDAGIDDLTFGDGGAASLGPSSAALTARAFSPNGDGSKDRLRIRWLNNVALDSLTLRVFRADGTLVGTRPLADRGSGAQAFDWDGSLTDIPSLADGGYVLQLVGGAGGTTYTAPSARPVTPVQRSRFGVTIDRVAPVATSASISALVLSPNGDGRFDTITAALAASGGSSWDFAAAPVSGSTIGAAVRRLAGEGSSTRIAWNGHTDADAVAPDGSYRVTLRVADRAGNRVTRAWTVRLDTLAPAVASTASPALISPNGDGAADSTTVRWSSTERVSGTARIVHGTMAVRHWGISGLSVGSIRWTGKDDDGRVVADGTYTMRIDVRDAAGNRTIVNRTVIVDRTAGFLRWSPGRFAPQDADHLLQSSRVTFKLVRGATVSLAIVDATGGVARTVWSNRSLAAGTWGWTWNGKLANGTYALPGRYTAVLTVVGRYGTATLRRTVYAGAFIISPSATTLRAGQKLSLTITTVEPLSTRPVVTFTQPGVSGVTKTASLVSTGVYRVSFTVAAGASGAATIAVRARDTASGMNRGQLTVRIQ